MRSSTSRRAMRSRSAASSWRWPRSGRWHCSPERKGSREGAVTLDRQLAAMSAPPGTPSSYADLTRGRAAADGPRGTELSVVIPLYNEEENIEPLYEALTATLSALGRSYEIVAVDDGSTDGTYTVLTRLAALDPRFKVIHFGRNFGQTAAMSAAFDHAEGN